MGKELSVAVGMISVSKSGIGKQERLKTPPYKSIHRGLIPWHSVQMSRVLSLAAVERG